jgi:hypothetical protein
MGSGVWILFFFGLCFLKVEERNNSFDKQKQALARLSQFLDFLENENLFFRNQKRN